MTQELAAMMLLGGAIATVSSLTTLFVHHQLTLRRDKLRKRRERQELAFLWEPQDRASSGPRVIAIGRYLKRRQSA